MGRLTVVRPGMHSTIQDLGRPGWGAMGVPVGGAADPISLRAGNRAAGNRDDAAAIEMTLVGGVFRFEDGGRVALAGAEGWIHGAESAGPRRPCAPWTATDLRPGEVLEAQLLDRWCRAYLCIGADDGGGVRAAPVMGSRSTYSIGAGGDAWGFGGHEGRPLRAGDVLEFEGAGGRGPRRRLGDAGRRAVEAWTGRRVLRATAGPHEGLFDRRAAGAFWGGTFTVLPQSNRMGARLDGPAVAAPMGGRMPSEGMYAGAVQVAGAEGTGQVIALLPDHPTTGGYPVIASIAAADLPALGQLRPNDRVRFERVSVERARELHAEQARALGSLELDDA
jgi:biotin-dependent carboxylase-like uncharacterized protein